MSRHTIIAQRLVLAGVSIIVLLAGACGGGAHRSAPSPADATPDAVATARAASDARIRFLNERAESDPLDTFGLNGLAQEYIQRARETGDVAELARAQTALERSLAVRTTDNYDAIALLGNLSVTQHNFRRGAELAQQAIAQKPKGAYAYGVLGDAYMGLGRYDEAQAAYDTMMRIDADLSAVSRQALLLAVRGRYDDAIAGWQRVIELASGDGVAEHTAWANAQLANVEFIVGDVPSAREHYEASLDAFPGYVHALAGLGRVTASEGDYATAIGYYRDAVDRIPLPEYVIALSDVYAASGDEKHANDEQDLVAAIEQVYRANGVNLDLQIALFDADRGRDLASTVERAKAAYASQPSIQAADVLAWAQEQSGDHAGARASIDQALRTGSRDPLIVFHAAMILKSNGEEGAAIAYLQALHDHTPRFSVRYASVAEQALADLRANVSR